MSETKPIEHPGWLTAGDFTDADEPLRLFGAWFAEAKRSEPVNPNAMALATVDADGSPNVRMVLLKDFDARGFVFYTNVRSVKGRELAETPKAALAFYWKSLQRQVRVDGTQEANHHRADHYADGHDQYEWRVPAPSVGHIQSHRNADHAAGGEGGLDDAHDPTAQLEGKQVGDDGKDSRADHAGENTRDHSGE